MKANRKKISETERTHLRRLTNSRIAHACSFVALVVILIDLAAFAIGQADEFFTSAGIMISIALLAIAMLNNPITLAPKKQADRSAGNALDQTPTQSIRPASQESLDSASNPALKK